MLCFPTQIKVGTLCVKDHQVLRLEHRLGLMEILNKRPPGLIAPLLKFCNLLGNPPINTTKGRDLIFNEGIRLLNMADNI